MKKWTGTLAALALAAGASVAPAASAQTGVTPPPSTASAYSEAELKTFASAAVEVMRVKDEYRARIVNTEDQQQVRQTEEAANRAIVQAVENKGLSPDRYRAILAYADAYPDVAARVRQYMESSLTGTP